MSQMQELVLAYLRKHPGAPFYAIDCAIGEQSDSGWLHHDFRRTDRALQSLRRKGLVEFRGQTHGWFPVEQVPARSAAPTKEGAV